jgi:DNA-binding Lrp family transcriptional regulator
MADFAVMSPTSGHALRVDRTDRAIIDQLRRDARLTNTELADRVGLTPSPCLRRVRRLEDEGIILGYHARIAPAALSRGFEVHVEFELASQAKDTVEAFESALVAFEEVVEARRMFGSPDYQALVAVADLPAYEQFLTQKLMALPGLGKLQSRFAMKTIKSDVPPIA